MLWRSWEHGKRCLVCHDEDSECKDTYLCKNWDCRRGGPADHHFFLCRSRDSKRSETDRPPRSSMSRHKLTEDQEKFVSELSSEMAERFRRAFTNITAKTHCADKPGVMESSALQELPVILMLLEVTANAGQKIGTLIDLASDTNYITHRAARRLNLHGEKISWVIHGVGGMAMKVLRGPLGNGPMGGPIRKNSWWSTSRSLRKWIWLCTHLKHTLQELTDTREFKTETKSTVAKRIF